MLPIANRPHASSPPLLAWACWMLLTLPALSLLTSWMEDCARDDELWYLEGRAGGDGVYRGESLDGSRFTLEVSTAGPSWLTWEGSLGTTVTRVAVDRASASAIVFHDAAERMAKKPTLLHPQAGVPAGAKRCLDVEFRLAQDSEGTYVGEWVSRACNARSAATFIGPLRSVVESARDIPSVTTEANRSVNFYNPFAMNDASSDESLFFPGRVWWIGEEPARGPVEGGGLSNFFSGTPRVGTATH